MNSFSLQMETLLQGWYPLSREERNLRANHFKLARITGVLFTDATQSINKLKSRMGDIFLNLYKKFLT